MLVEGRRLLSKDGLVAGRLAPTVAHCRVLVGARCERRHDAVRIRRRVQRLQPCHENMSKKRLPLLDALRGRIWPVLRQVAAGDAMALDGSAYSTRTMNLEARTETADRVVRSICPYCGIGCGQLVYVKDEKIIDIEGDPASPISQGCICPKGAATFQLVTGAHRLARCLYRRPGAAKWEEISLARAMDMIAERVKKARDENWEREVEGHTVHRTLAIAHLGGATLDNEENYLIKKLFTALGVVQVENQARI
jgi:formate dehydrogenase major subunit